MALLECYEIKEERFGPVVDKKAGDVQDTVLKLNVPKPIAFSAPEFDAGVAELSDAVDELQTSFIGDRPRVGPTTADPWP
ncbi:hypothetical protein IEQ34_019322 [Dendrobium chrysotoxum]|uniref:Uncharacterized protein n=1 Tax=Dendrobium chrysotoxum TaxID=161865 RepID=A0AAV7G8B3_DENCH|nr:hypothetical protein IEQ34_019322 [Dendrobium chrysotoxum]